MNLCDWFIPVHPWLRVDQWVVYIEITTEITEAQSHIQKGFSVISPEGHRDEVCAPW